MSITEIAGIILALIIFISISSSSSLDDEINRSSFLAIFGGLIFIIIAIIDAILT